MKKYFKKSFSLMLAVLMVLSCWVWIAPTQAEAATAGNYYVEVTWSANRTGQSGTPSLDFNDSGDCIGIAVDYITENGTGETKQHIVNLKGKTTNSDQVEKFTLSGFPVRLYAIVDHGSIFQTATLEVKKMKVGPSASTLTTIFDGVLSASSSTKFKSVSIDYLGKHYSQCTDGEADWDNTSVTVNAGTPVDRGNGTRGWDLPKPNSITGLGGTTNITIPDITNTTSVVSNTFTGVVKDQYSVNWYAAPKYNLAQSEGSSSSDMSDEESGFWWEENGDGATVKVNSTMQTIYNPTSTNDFTKDYYLVASLSENNGTAIASQKLHFTWPTYDWYFDGTVQGSGDTKADIIMQDGSIWDNGNGIIDAPNYLAYNQKSTIYPVDAKKEGYTFYGFWTVKQPSVIGQPGDAFAYEADFTQPISSEEYELLSDEEKAKHYNAGTKWDPKADSSQLTTTGDKKYYAWWNSDDITVKFYDVDGSFRGEKTVKYGQKNGAINPWPTPTESYSNGALSYSNWTGSWVNIDGEVVSSTNHTFTHDLILTPKYETVTSDYKYNVTFYKTFGSFGAPYSGEYAYRDPANRPTDLNEIGTLNADDGYTYEFEGWAVSAPINNVNYHIIQEDGDFDLNGNAVNLVSDFTVREDVTYYPVFRRYVRSYDVTFDYRDNTGAWKTVIKNFEYGARITAPDGVPTEYATGGYGYTFQGWTKGDADVNLNTELCVPGLTYTAKYSEGVPTPYTVSFAYRNEAGEEVIKTAQVNHGQNILQATVDSLEPAKEYDNGEALVTFNGVWEYNGARYNTADLTSFSPENHVTFTAIYENPKNFYTVTYVDGSNTKAYRVVDGTALPFWTYEVAGEGDATTEEDYVPSREDTLEGEYTFTGWFDAETGGTQYVPGETPVTGNVTLYPQFSFGLFEYHIVFKNWDGSELAKGTFNYGQSIESLTNSAINAAKRDADDTYTYQFLGWDKRVPTFCEGGEPDSTTEFIAQYKPVYIYYDVEWFNDEASMNADTEDVSTELHTSKYVYGDKIHTPSVTLTVPTGAPTGQNYVFAGWFYKDAQGTEHQFTRGLALDSNVLIDGTVKMYAKYVLTAKMWTVKVVNADTEYSFTVTDGANIKNLVADPAAGYVDKDYHNEFDGWTTDSVGGTAFDIENAAITADTTIYANFKVSAHSWTLKEVTVVPTYPQADYTDFDGNAVAGTNGKGEYIEWCSCSKTQTQRTVEIDALTDKVAPSGTGYIGTQWKSGDELAEGEKVYVDPKTDLIITTTDKGGCQCGEENCADCANDEVFNTTHKGIGVQKIEAVITSAAQEDLGEAIFASGNGLVIYDWTQIQASLIEYYEGWDNVPDMYKDYNANVTLKAGDYGLTNGDTYYAYIKITDKANNISYIGSAPFVYDTTAPVMTVEGDSNESEDTYCAEATVAVSDANPVTLTVNGAEVELAAAKDADGEVIEGTYTYKLAAGVYQVVVSDDAGNKTTAYFTVLEDHETREFTVDATCTQDGYVTMKCYNCEEEFGIIEEIPSTGHTALKTVTTDATCTTAGYDNITCSACGLEEKVYHNEDGTEKYPALGHAWSDWTTSKAATCQNNGVQTRSCSRCAESETKAIESLGTEHNWYPIVVNKATCTYEGSRTRTCRYCGEDEILETLAKTAHTEPDEYTVITEPGCEIGVMNEDATEYIIPPAYGVEAKFCTVCNVEIPGTRRDIKQLNNHTWVLNEEKSKEPTADAEGKLYYECSECTAYYTKTVAKIEQYTVTFMSEDGKTEVAKITKTVGETIAETDVPAQTKENTESTKYTFAGWYTEGDKQYSLPLEVTETITLYAKFNESAIIYTVLFSVPTKYENGKFTEYKEIKSLMGTIGEIREPAATPAFEADDYNTYAFKGWSRAGKLVEGDIIIEGDAEYVAEFTVTPITYDVIFMSNGVALGSVKVNAGGTADYSKISDKDPEMESDANYHYTFDGWNKALTNITVKTTVEAVYEKAPHDWDEGTLKQAATCTQPELKTFKCNECGYEKTEQTAAANNHVEDELVFDESTGENVYKCKVCGEEIRRVKASYTIKFVNFNNIPLETKVVAVNGEVTFTKDAPTRASDDMYSYTFAGWVDAAGNEYKVGDKLPNATADATYTAYYTEKDREYRVTFLDKDGKILQTNTYKYGANVAYEGNTAELAVPASDSKGHWEFDAWDTKTDNITADTLVRPIFKQSGHTYTQSNTGATCTEAGGIKHLCACGYYYIDGNVPAKGHKWTLVQEIAPDYTTETNGKRVYSCENGCGETYEEVISGSLTQIVVTVKDQSGAAVNNALVRLYAKDAEGNYVDTGLSERTKADGIAEFFVEPGEYRVFISVDGMEETWYDVAVDEEGNVEGNQSEVVVQKPVVDTSCSCSCHRDNFWGAIYRFFQKIIKLFTGKPNCCADPDSRI